MIAALLLKYIIPRTSLYYRYKLFQPVFGNYLNEQQITMISGERKRIYVKNINKRMWYDSTDFKVANVNQFGIVTASKPGLSFILVKMDGKVLKCRVRVIELNLNSITLAEGKTKWLNVRGCVFLERYKSSNTTVVEVSRFGRLKAKKEGTAVITVKAYGRTMECRVTVVKKR